MKTLTTQQEEMLSKSYDWCTNVVGRQRRFLPIDTMWQAYPFKRNGLTKDGLSVLLDKMQTELENKGNVEIPVKQQYCCLTGIINMPSLNSTQKYSEFLLKQLFEKFLFAQKGGINTMSKEDAVRSLKTHIDIVIDMELIDNNNMLQNYYEMKQLINSKLIYFILFKS